MEFESKSNEKKSLDEYLKIYNGFVNRFKEISEASIALRKKEESAETTFPDLRYEIKKKFDELDEEKRNFLCYEGGGMLMFPSTLPFVMGAFNYVKSSLNKQHKPSKKLPWSQYKFSLRGFESETYLPTKKLSLSKK